MAQNKSKQELEAEAKAKADEEQAAKAAKEAEAKAAAEKAAAEAQAKSEAEAKAKADEEQAASRKAYPYRVAKGRAINSSRGMLVAGEASGDRVRAQDFPGGKERCEALVEAKVLERR